MRFRAGPRAPSIARTVRPRRVTVRCNLLLGSTIHLGYFLAKKGLGSVEEFPIERIIQPP